MFLNNFSSLRFSRSYFHAFAVHVPPERHGPGQVGVPEFPGLDQDAQDDSVVQLQLIAQVVNLVLDLGVDLSVQNDQQVKVR